MALVSQRFESIQYDGTNSAAILAFVTGYHVVSESGGVLYALHESGNADFELNTGDYLVRFRAPDGGGWLIGWHGSASAYAQVWIEGA